MTRGRPISTLFQQNRPILFHYNASRKIKEKTERSRTGFEEKISVGIWPYYAR
jgi:hypothetical protein